MLCMPILLILKQFSQSYTKKFEGSGFWNTVYTVFVKNYTLLYIIFFWDQRTGQTLRPILTLNDSKDTKSIHGKNGNGKRQL